MAYDEGLAERVRMALNDRPEIAPHLTERKMFGGLAFMVRGNMSVGISGDNLLVRVGKEGHDAALAQPHARPMDFTGKPMKGFIYVDPLGVDSEDDLEAWIERSLAYALTLPPK